MFKRNEFKFSVVRNFGTEQVSLTATVYSFSTNVDKITKKVCDGIQKGLYQFYVETDKRAEQEIAWTKEKFKDNPDVLKQINKATKN